MEYLIIILLTWALSHTFMRDGAVRRNCAVATIAALPIVLLVGLRYNTGTDYDGYERLYDSFPSYNSEYLEPGFRFVLALGHAARLPYAGFLTLCALPIAFQFYWFARISSGALASVIFCGYGLIVYMGGIRQGIAMTLLFGGFVGWYKKEYMRAALWLAAAPLFHITSIVYVAMFPLLTLRYSRWVMFLAVIGCIVAGLTPIPERLLSFSDGYEYVGRNTIGVGSEARDIIIYCEWVFTIVACLYISGRYNDPRLRIFINVTVFGGLIYLCFWHASRMAAGRLPLYSRASQAIVLGSCAVEICARLRIRRNVVAVLIAVPVLARVYVTLVVANPYYYPYDSVIYHWIAKE